MLNNSRKAQYTILTILAGMPRQGTWYNPFKTKFETNFEQTWNSGTAVFQYPNNQRATTLWYHDHKLGMTRLNVYIGPAGFYNIRGGPDGAVIGILPGPTPVSGWTGTKF